MVDTEAEEEEYVATLGHTKKEKDQEVFEKWMAPWVAAVCVAAIHKWQSCKMTDAYREAVCDDTWKLLQQATATALDPHKHFAKKMYIGWRASVEIMRYLNDEISCTWRTPGGVRVFNEGRECVAHLGRLILETQFASGKMSAFKTKDERGDRLVQSYFRCMETLAFDEMDALLAEAALTALERSHALSALHLERLQDVADRVYSTYDGMRERVQASAAVYKTKEVERIGHKRNRVAESDQCDRSDHGAAQQPTGETTRHRPDVKKARTNVTRDARFDKGQCMYVLYSKKIHTMKIGVTSDLGRRFPELTPIANTGLDVVLYVYVTEAESRCMERVLLEKFRKKYGVKSNRKDKDWQTESLSIKTLKERMEVYNVILHTVSKYAGAHVHLNDRWIIPTSSANQRVLPA